MMDKLIKFLQRLTCRLQGHDWRYSATLGENARGQVWVEDKCERCRARRQRTT